MPLLDQEERYTLLALGVFIVGMWLLGYVLRFALYWLQ